MQPLGHFPFLSFGPNSARNSNKLQSTHTNCLSLNNTELPQTPKSKCLSVSGRAKSATQAPPKRHSQAPVSSASLKQARHFFLQRISTRHQPFVSVCLARPTLAFLLYSGQTVGPKLQQQAHEPAKTRGPTHSSKAKGPLEEERVEVLSFLRHFLFSNCLKLAT